MGDLALSQDEIEKMLAEAGQSYPSYEPPPAAPPPPPTPAFAAREPEDEVVVAPVEFKQFAPAGARPAPVPAAGNNLDLLRDVILRVTVELGRVQMSVKDVLNLGAGSIIELDKLAGEPVDILVNGMTIALGEVVVVDEKFGVRVTKVLSPQERG